MQRLKLSLRITTSVLVGIALHIGIGFLSAFGLMLATDKLAGDGLVLVFCIYLPFLAAGAIMGSTRGLAEPVISAILSAATVVFVLTISSDKILALPAIALSGFAFGFQKKCQ